MQEQAEAKLGAALKATGYAAGFTLKQLEGYASEFQNMTTFGDEATFRSLTMLAAFKNIRGDNFKQAEQVMNAVCDIKVGLGGILILFWGSGIHLK